MIEFKDKKVHFIGRGFVCEKDELLKYLIQNEALIVDSIDEADIIIQGYMTPVYVEDELYQLSKNGVHIVEIDVLEKQFSLDIDIDSVLMAIKISKDQDRLLKLLSNKYFSNDIFVQLLNHYDWGSDGLYDNDNNRDVSTSVVNRFCTLQQTNHNIQHSPIGIYYTALETNNGKLLKVIYNMPEFKISDKNALIDQPLTLKGVVSLNTNTPKPLLMQILKNGNLEELKFLALNSSINKMICNTLYSLNNYTIKRNLIRSGNLDIQEYINDLMSDEKLKIEVLKYVNLEDQIFDKIINYLKDDVSVVYLSQNSSLNIIQIDKLFEFDVENANINLLKNSNCSYEKLEEFFNKNDLIYNISIAHNEKLEESFFDKLLLLNDINIDLSLSVNTKTPAKIIEQLYSKNNDQINIALSCNENTPINILFKLQVDHRYVTNVSNNETYRAFSRKSLGIIEGEKYQ